LVSAPLRDGDLILFAVVCGVEVVSVSRSYAKILVLCLFLVGLPSVLYYSGKITPSGVPVTRDGHPDLARQIKLKRVKLSVFNNLIHLEKQQLRDLRQLREITIADVQMAEFRLESAAEVVQAFEINLALAEEALGEGNVIFAQEAVKDADADLAFLERYVTGKVKGLF
jgi:hypothetical protein